MSTPYYARKQISFHNNQAFNLSPNEMLFWESLKNCFLSDNWFKSLVLDKYQSYFSLRFGSIIEDVDFLDLLKSELFLQRHEIGFHIGPHTDIPPRIFTCIFSFARREGFEEFGTQLLRPRDRMVRCWGNNHYDHERFEVDKLAPYKPNNFLLFFKTRQSFHSVKAIDSTVPDQRFGMQFQLYEPTGGLFRDLSEPNILDIRISKTAP